jgi:hypothetical protein
VGPEIYEIEKYAVSFGTPGLSAVELLRVGLRTDALYKPRHKTLLRRITQDGVCRLYF